MEVDEVVDVVEVDGVVEVVEVRLGQLKRQKQ